MKLPALAGNDSGQNGKAVKNNDQAVKNDGVDGTRAVTPTDDTVKSALVKEIEHVPDAQRGGASLQDFPNLGSCASPEVLKNYSAVVKRPRSGVTSKELVVNRGVHQGALLSMRMYQLYNNDLLWELKQHPASVGIFELRTGVPSFADDIALLTLFKLAMNVLLGIAYTHSHVLR